jgi:FHA domain-containing protein
LPAAPVGRAPQRSPIDDALGAFVSGAASSPPAGASGGADLLGALGSDPLAARAVDELLGAPGDGADALAAFLDDGARKPTGAAPVRAAGAASNHVHDLHAAFSPSSFDLGRVGSGEAAAPAPRAPPPAQPLSGAAGGSPGAATPAAAPTPAPKPRPAADSAPSPLGAAAAAPVRPQAAPTTKVDAKVTAPAALGGARLGDQTRIHSSPAPLAASPAAPSASMAAVAPIAPVVAAAPVVRPTAGAFAASAPTPLDQARNTAPAPLSRPAPLGESAPAAPRVNRMVVPSGAATAESAAAAPTASRDELWQAFCDAAGVNIDAPQGLSPEMMRVIGQLLRASVDGTVQLMAIRSATKHELRAEMTLIQPRNNNPLKFSPDGHAALELLLQPPMRGFLPGPAAMTDAMHDLVGHSIGTMAGMRAALDGVLGRFAPAQLENKLTGKSVIDSLLPMNRRSRLWELYLQHFETIRDEAQDDFHTLFGRAFLAAYEQQLDRLHEQQAAAAPTPGVRRP